MINNRGEQCEQLSVKKLFLTQNQVQKMNAIADVYRDVYSFIYRI